jgi:RNA polymerase-binding transcription factor DksA
MAPIDEQAVRQRLTAERLRLEHEIFELTEGSQSLQSFDAYADASGLKSEQADDAEIVFEAQRTRGVVENAQRLLAEVEAALRRLDAALYGVCATCGKAINPRRLEVLPYATLCIECQSKVDARATR